MISLLRSIQKKVRIDKGFQVLVHDVHDHISYTSAPMD